MSDHHSVFTTVLRKNPGYGFLVALVMYLLLQMFLVAVIAPLLGQIFGLESTEVEGILSGELSLAPNGHAYFRLIQFLNQAVTWGLPAWLLARWLGSPRQILSLNRPRPAWLPFLAAGIMVVSIPVVQWVYLPDSVLELPEQFSDLEEMLKSQEELGQNTLMELFSQGGMLSLLANLVVFALMPAICEELFFRGYMLGHARSTWNVHVSIWVVAAIFSFIHFQIPGFFARFLLGGFLGYFVVYGGSLFSSIAAHFTFNGIAILAQALSDPETPVPSGEAARPAWYLALASAFLAAFLIQRYRQSAASSDSDPSV